MMSRRRAARLARQAARRNPVTARPARAARAWRRLLRAGDRGDQAAVDAVRRMWLEKPYDRERWNGEARRHSLAEMYRETLAVAVDPGRSSQTRAKVGVFCAVERLIPDGEAERVLFYVMTGQVAQCQAADPDGSLLAAVYRSADEATRGYYTRWLRALAAAAVGASGVIIYQILT